MTPVTEQRRRIGRFDVLEDLGPGRRGRLFRARDAVAGRDVAVEVCEEGVGIEPGERARRERAVRAAASASHPRAVGICEAGEQDGCAFFVSEWPSGRSLVDACANGTFLSIAEALRVVADLCVALQAAHENGVVHGDLHPGSVWLEPDGPRSAPFDRHRGGIHDGYGKPGARPANRNDFPDGG